MTTPHLVIFVEEQSMEAFLRVLLARRFPGLAPDIHPFQGKSDLLGKLEGRLRGYVYRLPADSRIIVVVDRDNDDCGQLKRRLESIAARVGFHTRSQTGNCRWQVVNRIAIEELEAWYFGDHAAICSAYPKVPATVFRQARFSDSDAIRGGTWEAFERILKKYGYFKGGLRKIEAARAIAAHIDPQRNRSRSFQVFYNAIDEAAA